MPSRGDLHFPGLLDAWEEAERLGKEVWSEEIQYTRHAWVVNLDHYIRCFWLTGLALTLDIPDDQWQRLLTLMGNEGQDAFTIRHPQGVTTGPVAAWLSACACAAALRTT